MSALTYGYLKRLVIPPVWFAALRCDNNAMHVLTILPPLMSWAAHQMPDVADIMVADHSSGFSEWAKILGVSGVGAAAMALVAKVVFRKVTEEDAQITVVKQLIDELERHSRINKELADKIAKLQIEVISLRDANAELEITIKRLSSLASASRSDASDKVIMIDRSRISSMNISDEQDKESPTPIPSPPGNNRK